MQQLAPHGTLKTVTVQIFLPHDAADIITPASVKLWMPQPKSKDQMELLHFFVSVMQSVERELG